MPLSEEELRLLEQMEQALAADDPKLASTLRGRSLERATRTRMVVAGVAFVVGIVVLMGGAMAQITPVGILGFVLMLASATLGLAAWRGRHAPPRPHHDAQGTDHLFDFDDQPHRFEVIDGGRSARRGRHPQGRGPRPRKQGTFLQRMEQRWERRRHEGF